MTHKEGPVAVPGGALEEYRELSGAGEPEDHLIIWSRTLLGCVQDEKGSSSVSRPVLLGELGLLEVVNCPRDWRKLRIPFGVEDFCEALLASQGRETCLSVVLPHCLKEFSPEKSWLLGEVRVGGPLLQLLRSQLLHQLIQLVMVVVMLSALQVNKVTNDDNYFQAETSGFNVIIVEISFVIHFISYCIHDLLLLLPSRLDRDIN